MDSSQQGTLYGPRSSDFITVTHLRVFSPKDLDINGQIQDLRYLAREPEHSQFSSLALPFSLPYVFFRSTAN